MSLAIDVDLVTEVLLADGWHTVKDWSFAIDSYEYIWGTGSEVLLGGGNEPTITEHARYLNASQSIRGALKAIKKDRDGGQPKPKPDPARRFGFTDESDSWMCGPLTAILAVRVEK